MGIKEDNLERANAQKEQFASECPKDGIKWERSCTDSLCCIAFLAFLVAMLGVSGWALGEGDPLNIITPFDSVGNQCGAIGTDFEEYKLKHFTSLLTSNGVGPNLYYAVCVSECPKKMEMGQDYNDKCKINADISDCNSFTAMYDTEPMMNYCLPTKEDSIEAYNYIQEEIDKQSGMGQFILQVQESWEAIVIMSIVTVLISIVYVWLLKIIVKPILYISMLIILLMFIVMAAYGYQVAQQYEQDSDDWKMAMAGSITCGVVGILYALFICCNWNNIRLGAAIMQAASQFVAQNVRVVAVPVLSYIVVIPIFCMWAFCAVHLYAIGEAQFVEDQFMPTIVWKKEIEYIFWFYLFGLLWIMAFIIAVAQFIIAACACMWYYTGQGGEMSDSPYSVDICKAFRWATWYHCGSIAFGSFLIAVVQMIRIIFEYMIYQYEKVGNKENPVYKCFKCVARCILWCLDQCVQFITKNAYIQIALHSSTFCTAAWDSFCLCIRHIGRFSSASMIGGIMMALGKGTIVASSMCLTYIMIENMYEHITQPIVGTVVVGLVAYLVGSLFLSVFSFSATAILHSFILAEDQGGNAHSPECLADFLEENDKPVAIRKKGDD